MMKYVITLALLIPLITIGQNIIYQPHDYSRTNQMLIEALDNSQRVYNANLNYSTNLINWAIELKGQSNESEFITKIDKYIEQIRQLQSGDLSRHSKALKQIETQINEEIIAHNKRFEEAERKKPAENTPLAHWERGKKLFDEKNYRLAINEFQKVLAAAPNEASSHFYIAESYGHLNNLNDAELYYLSSLRYEANAMTYDHLGWLYMAKAEPMKALECFNEQIDLTPSQVSGYYNRGWVKSDLKDYNGAIGDYRHAIAINPEIAILYNNLAWTYYLKKDYKQALIQINLALQKANNDPIIWDSKTDIVFALKDYQTSIECADNALKLDPKLANSYFVRGRANYRLGNHAEACEDWSLAGQYGKEEAYEYIKKYCNGK